MTEEQKRNEHFPYLPHTEADRQDMLKAIGVRTFDELLSHIPASVRAKELELPAGLSELELTQAISQMAAKNNPASKHISFLGGGSYRRYVPAAVSSLISRSEFATAYTPYQPEVSQGSLQAIYEFQTAICLLTDMEVANASMYDGPTACAEAALMSCRLTERSKLIMLDSVNPEYRQVCQTYAQTVGLTLETVEVQKGVCPAGELKVDDKTACVIVQYPNYFGCLEDLEELAKAAHKHGALLVVVSDPISLGLLKAPGSFGADLVVGDAQQCGNNLSFGGPSAGYMATRMEYVRQLPGRLAGMTQDKNGKRAFTLTLQTREQHIRRAKATSNICTNQALNALAMLVYLTMMGKHGLREVAEISLRRAHYLKDALTANKEVTLKFDQPCFNEFVVQTPLPAADVLSALKEDGILGGIDLGRFYSQYANCILIAVTEMNSVADLDTYARAFSRVLAGAQSAGSGSGSGSKQAKALARK